MNSASTGSQRLIVGGWILCALAALPFALHINDQPDASARLAASESAKVEVASQTRFQSPFAYIDLRRVSAHETRVGELRVLPLAVLVLFLAFGSLVCGILPILCGGLTIGVALGALAAVNQIWPTSIIVVSIITMVGLGLSVDYA